MSAEEKLQYDLMAKEMAAIKRWLPIFMFVGAIIGASVQGTHWWDNNVGQKSDTESIKKEQREEQQKTRDQIADLKRSLDGHIESEKVAKVTINKRIDSLGHVTFYIQKRIKYALVTENYPNGYNGHPVIKPAN